jgi:hypothetical protein
VLASGSDGTDKRTLKTDTTGDLSVFQLGYGTFATNPQAVTGTAANLGTNTAKAVCLIAFSTNTATVYVGATGVTASTGFPLVAGQPNCIQVNNTNLVFIVGTSGDKVGWELIN